MTVEIYLQGVLFGYMAGSIDVAMTASAEATQEGRSLNGLALTRRASLCAAFPEEKYDIHQLRDVVKKYLSDNPEKRHEEAGLLALSAISAAFPCN